MVNPQAESSTFDFPVEVQTRNQEGFAEGRLAGLYEAALNSVAMALLIVDSRRNVLYRNEAAEQWFAGQPGLAILRGRLVAHAFEVDTTLQRLVTAATSTVDASAKGMSLSLAHPGALDWQIFFVPLREPDADAGSSAQYVMMIVGDPNRNVGPTVAQLRQMFSLTVAEVRLAIAVCNGMSVHAFALHARVSVNTTRSQLRAILQKTGTHRQADLVRLLLSAPRLADHP